MLEGEDDFYASAEAALAAADIDLPTTKPLLSPAIRLLIHVPFNIFKISSIRFWFSSFVRVDARMEKH